MELQGNPNLKCLLGLKFGSEPRMQPRVASLLVNYHTFNRRIKEKSDAFPLAIDSMVYLSLMFNQ